MKRHFVVLGIILLLIGIFYVAAPHYVHIASRFDFGLEHNAHQVFGVVFVLAGVISFWKSKAISHSTKS